MRVSPASRNAKPACMNITRTAVMTTQIVDMPTSRSCLDIRGDPFQARARSVVHDVRHGGGPAEPVTRLVTAPRRIDDRCDHVADDPVGDDEDEQRLRQEPRLKYPAAIL